MEGMEKFFEGTNEKFLGPINFQTKGWKNLEFFSRKNESWNGPLCIH